MHKPYLLFVFSVLIMSYTNGQWDQGWYYQNDTWNLCEPTCKTWIDGNQWQTWEDYMFQNQTTGYCEFWNEAEYYDVNTKRCRSCDGFCSSFWSYQSLWFECPDGEMFDTDSLQWVSTWDNPKSIINNTDLSIPLVCRSNDFYVDVYSESIIELGTRQYPYKSVSALFVELLNYHSNQDKSVVIYLKESQNHYMEDGANYIMNITNVTITTYTDEQAILFKAKLIPTRISQSAENKKTSFSLLSNFSLKLDEVISEGGYTETESSQLNDDQVTLYILRSSVYIDNIDVERDSGDFDLSSIFVYLIFLQDNTIQMTNMDINITGNIANGIDPFNGFFENMTIDTYGLRGGLEFFTVWNYPEASVKNELYYDNIKVIKSGATNLEFSAGMIDYQGPGNMTVKNSDFIEFYNAIGQIK